MSAWNLANQNLRHLVPYEPGKPIDDVARELGLNPAEIIKLASNENPLGPSPKALQAMIEAAAKTHIYPDGGSFHLREAVSQKFGINKQQVILGNGSNELIELLYHAFTKPGQTSVVASRYAFVVYKLMAELFNVTFIEVPDLDFRADLKAMLAAIRPDTRLVFIANPNNPTGVRIPNRELEDFIDQVPETALVVLDEAYYEFLDHAPDSLGWIKAGKRVVALRTFSKIQGLAGLRIGYGFASQEIVEILQRCRQPFNINALAQAAALAGLTDLDHMAKTMELTLKGRARLEQFFQQQGLRYLPSEANFVMVEVGNADAVFQGLLKRGVIIRSMTSYGLPSWVRVSIGTAAEMAKFEADFIEVLSDVQTL
ncbi:MAG: histidinol-phosphate transaminase [Blastochloris sp.]|jgi:histidinol-phosphate aminotransferase|nr:histidinol-phosphate transaminase [Blastochloris sp.]